MINSVLKNKIYILLAVIVLLAGVLRFYKIDQIPVSIYWDEASSTYNAYSIAETGKDEFGNNLPLLFRAFNDYKTPANIYLTAISVKLFGLNEFSARFSSALLGTLTILATFLLIKELIRRKLFEVEPEYIALLTALLVAISPVHIQFSRTGFEANSGLFFVVFGGFLFFKFINSKKYKFLVSSLAVYAISIYFYRSIWIFTPLFLTSIFLIYRKTLFAKENLKKTILSIVIFALIVLPFVPKMLSPEGQVRVTQTGVVNNSDNEIYKAILEMEKSNSPIAKLIYNRRIVYVDQSVKGYLAHFSPKFLFLEGDGNLRHGVPGVGIFYIWGILFIILGIFALTKLERKKALGILAWILIAPIPAAFSVPAPHALRSLSMIPMLQLLIALGAFWVIFKVGEKYRAALSAIIIGICLFFVINYLSIYFGGYGNKSSSDWADGYKQLTTYVFENENKYDKILISGHYWQPYVYFLFYKKYDPSMFQNSGSKTAFDKYVFGGTSWDNEGKELGDQNLEKIAGTNNYLVALSPIEFSLQKQNLNVINEVRNHNGEIVFIVAEPK